MDKVKWEEMLPDELLGVIEECPVGLERVADLIIKL